MSPLHRMRQAYSVLTARTDSARWAALEHVRNGNGTTFEVLWPGG